MLRITAGEFRGRNLKTPKGHSTRPTPSRIREALFNVLGDAVRGTVFYDLFAGSGAMGIEALSRGASSAVFIEAMREAYTCLQANVRILDLQDRARCLQWRAPACLTAEGFPLPDGPAVFFIDPPYHQQLALKTAQTLMQVARQIPDCPWQETLLTMQTEKSQDLPERFHPWVLYRQYKHGDSNLWVYSAS